MRRFLLILSAFFAVFSTTCWLSAGDWPEYRGPGGQGHASGPAPLNWSENQHVVWKTPLEGKGWSTPVVSDDQIWITTATTDQASAAEIEERLATNTGNQPLDVVNNLTMRAICIDRTNGQIIHDLKLMTKQKPEPVHELNSYASPSPIVDEGHVYFHFGPNGTACVEADSGNILWVNQSKELIVKTENGAGSTPVLWNDLLITHFDGSDRQFIAALDTASGRVVWKTDRSGQMNENPQLKKCYGTPLLVTISGKLVVISPAADWLYAYDPATGKELWKLSYGDLGFSVVPRPVEKDGTVFVCTSFMRSRLLAVELEQDGSQVEPRIKWQYAKQVSQMPSPIVVEDLIYFVSDKGGVLTCLDADTGDLVWLERLGGNFSSSPLFADGKLYFCDREGITHVIQPGREFHLLAKNQLDGSIMASPVVVDGSMYLRTDNALYRIE